MSETRKHKRPISKKALEAELLELVFDRTVRISSLLAQQLVYPQKEDVLSALQKKIVLYLISEVGETDTAFMPHTLKISLLAKIVGYKLSGGSNVKNFYRNITELPDKCFEVYSARGEKNQWITAPVFHEDTATVELRLHDDMRPYVLNLEEKQSTVFPYKFVVPLQKKHSVDLYLLLRSAIKSYRWEEKMTRFYWKLGDAYDHFSAVEKNVLRPCLKEINDLTDLIVDYTPVYYGRLATSIQFSVYENLFHADDPIKNKA